MAEYRIEWQISGEFRAHVGMSPQEVRRIVNDALEGVGEDLADNVCDDLESHPMSYSHNGEATVSSLSNE